MTLIHSALLCEAQPLIETFKLEKVINKKEYKNNFLVLIVSGVGEKKTSSALTKAFKTYPIKKAINIGIAGCKDKTIPIGSLFCTNRELKNIAHAQISTVKAPTKDINTLLADMESRAFCLISKEKGVDFYVFKVVSDYLDDTIPPKSFATKLIRDVLPKWKHYI